MSQHDELVLPDKPLLDDFQQYVRAMKRIRGFEDNAQRAFILLVEEVGELGKGIRKTWSDSDPVTEEQREHIALEMADIMIYLLDIANQYGISLEEAFRTKEEINKKRIWQGYLRDNE